MLNSHYNPRHSQPSQRHIHGAKKPRIPKQRGKLLHLLDPTLLHRHRQYPAGPHRPLHLRRELRRKQRLFQPRAEPEVEHVIKEGQVVGVGPAHERRGLDELDAGDVSDAEMGECHDLVAGAGGDAEDLGVVVEEVDVVEGVEEEGEGTDVIAPRGGGPEALVLLVERDVVTGSVVAGVPGEAELRLWGGIGCDAGVGGLEEEDDEGEAPDDQGDVREALQEHLYVTIHHRRRTTTMPGESDVADLAERML